MRIFEACRSVEDGHAVPHEIFVDLLGCGGGDKIFSEHEVFDGSFMLQILVRRQRVLFQIFPKNKARSL